MGESIQFGATYRDKISGFTGVCTSRCEDIVGGEQATLERTGDCEKKWFDVSRLELDETVEAISLG